MKGLSPGHPVYLKGLWGFMLILVLLNACAVKVAQPVENKDQEKAADRDDFIQVRESPNDFVGSLVEWDGVIVRLRYVIDGTEFIIRETPVEHRGEPGWEKYSNGRFIARYSHLVDPDVFAKGTKVTLSGEVMGAENETLKGKTYNLPVLRVKRIRVWRPYRYWPHYYNFWLWERREEPFDEPEMPYNEPFNVPQPPD